MNTSMLSATCRRAAGCVRCSPHITGVLAQSRARWTPPQVRHFHETTTMHNVGRITPPKKRERRAPRKSMTIETQEVPHPVTSVPSSPASATAITLPSSMPSEVNGFIYVGVDGDACQFHQDLIVRGRKGGWEVAERLVQEIKKIFGLKKGDPTDVVVQIFVNQGGHMRNGWRQFRIHQEVSAAFFEGLNEADPLVNVVNAGSSKEATDIKVKGGLEFHIKLANCTRVALAGLSDGAYASLLKSLITRGQRDKIVLLKTSTDIAQLTKYITKGFVNGEYSLPLVPLPEDMFQHRPLRTGEDDKGDVV
ncbi:hypothetical protein P389DRAFT_51149 [Cystobasidium minutum MCA 4210]|uniref:uncharacterized protein n=1 Tax=Cystobasidium minutum MCA 4210 TaxID=1397322 RepID=UPI0034CD7195|eukprot:jgi/Rhomi1/51149/CE51148_79